MAHISGAGVERDEGQLVDAIKTVYPPNFLGLAIGPRSVAGLGARAETLRRAACIGSFHPANRMDLRAA